MKIELKPCVRFALALFVWALLFSVKSILIIAAAVLLHECAHILACLIFKVQILGFEPLPWGLTVATPLIYDKKLQFAISIAGPACNLAVLAVCCALRAFMPEDSGTMELFMLANLADGLLNLLPALPLDGGIILKSRLCSAFGLAAGFKAALRITAAAGALILAFGIEVLIATGYNFSYIAAALFILSNLRHERELLMCIKKRVFTGEIKSAERVKYVSVDASCNAICLANLISCSHTLVFLVNDGGRFSGEVTQEQLIKKLFENSLITVGECIEKI